MKILMPFIIKLEKNSQILMGQKKTLNYQRNLEIKGQSWGYHMISRHTTEIVAETSEY
jgi:hypothetical protein